ncbi:MAG: hypothetical protein PHI97_12260 [Desulfobulbus sp.]|nr:hypothetical protein [Desulfobulbus sp.]
MIKDTLYLHVGWSKTGTSAIQAQIHRQNADFINQSILYPQTLQWADHSHHPFALSFQGCGTYQGEMSPIQALEKLTQEMAGSPANNILLSSELSPFYFDNPAFKDFVAAHFSRVFILFTIRVQSELILSLFNQLIKDTNVRYNASLFTLATRNLTWLNFRQNIMRWSNVVGRENVLVIPYGKDVVARFFHHFRVTLQPGTEDEISIVNPSLPTRCLALLQQRGRNTKNPAEYARIKEEVVKNSATVPQEYDRYQLFSVPEQHAYDDHFKNENLAVAEMFQFDPGAITKADYKPVKVLPPGFPLENFSAN